MFSLLLVSLVFQYIIITLEAHFVIRTLSRTTHGESVILFRFVFNMPIVENNFHIKRCDNPRLEAI